MHQMWRRYETNGGCAMGLIFPNGCQANSKLYPFTMTLPKSGFKAERAVRALQELSDAAAENGTSEMTLEEINAEIEAVRKKK